MRLLVRASAFIIGALVTFLFAGIMDDLFPWYWLPLLMGLGVAGVVASQTWLRPLRIGPYFVAALTSGTALTYSYSTRSGGVTRIGSFLPHLALMGSALLFALAFVLFAGMGLSRPQARKTTVWLVIPILAGCIIGYVSGGIGGSDHMVRWLITVTHWPQDRAETVVHIFRKGVHLSAYGVVGLSLFRAGVAGRTTRFNAVLFAMLTVLCMASFDEIRQTTAPNRTGSAWDVALDMLGAFLFTLMVMPFTKALKGSAGTKAVN